MTEVLNLDTFVNQMALEGSHDSQGHFTLAEEKARKKLADFALAEPLAWVNKMLQALTRWNVTALEVKQTRLFTSFYFCPSDLTEIPTENQILQVFESGHIDTESPLFLFCLALRTLVGQASMSFLCNARYQDREFKRPLASGADASHLSNRQRRAWTTLRSDGLVLSVSHVKEGRSLTARYLPTLSIAHNIQFDVDVGRLLTDAAPFLPFPVYLDTRLVSSIATHPKYGFQRMSQPLVLSGVDVEGIDPLLAGDHLEEKVMSLFTTPQRCLRTYSRRRRFSAWLLVLLRTGPTALESRNHSYIVLTWLKYGVKARRKTYALHNQFLDIHVFVNGDDEETDLSGMLMIETDRLLILERAVMRAVQKRLDDLGNQVPNLLRDDLDIHSRHDRHSKIPSFDGKDFDQVSVMDVFTAPSSEVFLNGLPFLFSSVGYHFREVKAQVEEVLECKEVLTDTWSERLIQDFHALQNTILENFVREPN